MGKKCWQDRRKNPRDDLLTVIATTEVDGEPMDQSYLDGSWLLIIFAGNDTTRNSLSGTMRLLTQFKDQKQMLLDDLNLVPKMVPEALRLVSPVMYMRRTALAEAEFSGQANYAGRKSRLCITVPPIATRMCLQKPDKMDIHRNNTGKTIWPLARARMSASASALPICKLETAYKRILDRFRTLNGRASSAMRRIISSMRFHIWKSIWAFDNARHRHSKAQKMA